MSTTNRGVAAAGGIDEKIGRRVAELRGSVSQAEVARRVTALGGRLAQTYLSELERGERRWNSELLYYVAGALGVRLADLMPDGDRGVPGDFSVRVSQEELATLMTLRTRGARAAIVHIAASWPEG